jgi:hypothetical protein
MKLMLATVLALLLVSATPRTTTGNDDTGWSPPVNGLQARLGLERGQALNGTPLITTWLELRNVANVANVMEVPLNLDAIQFEVAANQERIRDAATTARQLPALRHFPPRCWVP